MNAKHERLTDGPHCSASVRFAAAIILRAAAADDDWWQLAARRCGSALKAARRSLELKLQFELELEMINSPRGQTNMGAHSSAHSFRSSACPRSQRPRPMSKLCSPRIVMAAEPAVRHSALWGRSGRARIIHHGGARARFCAPASGHFRAGRSKVASRGQPNVGAQCVCFPSLGRRQVRRVTRRRQTSGASRPRRELGRLRCEQTAAKTTPSRRGRGDLRAS